MARPCCGSTSLCWFLCCYSSCFGLLAASSLASCFPWWPGCGQQHCEHSTSHPCSQPRCCWTLRETPAGGSLCFTAHAGDHEHFETVFCQSPGQVPFLRPLVQPAHTLTWSWAVTLQPCCLCPVLRHWRGTHVAPWGARSGRESPSSCTAVPGCPGRSQAEQVALPEVRMEPKLSFAFALAHCGCSYKLRTAGESKRVVAPETPRAAPNSPNPPPLPPASAPCAFLHPHDAPEPGAGCTKPFSCPHLPLGFWKTNPSPGAPEDAGLGCDEDLGCRALQPLLCGCIICSSSSPAPGALPGRWEVGQVPIWGAERCWEPWAGQAGAVTTARSGVNGSL